jgi:Tol biopolymer transport system component
VVGPAAAQEVRPDGTGVRQLTDAPGFDGGPNYAPNGRKIAFDSERDGDGDIWVMGRDGGNATQLTGRAPDENAGNILNGYSPDGRFIAFSSDRDSQFEVYVMRADGSSRPTGPTTTLSTSIPTGSPSTTTTTTMTTAAAEV